MFGKRFAFQNGWEGGWTPPWLQEERPEFGPRFFGRGHHGPMGPHGPFGPGPRFFMRRGRGPFGPGGPFGPEGPFGPGGESRRFFGRGDLKFALLELLQERPMHGYEMMKALEEKSGGFYTSSPGSVYPTLQMLEDRGFVSVQEADGKKVYSLTDAGRAFLADRRKTEEEFTGPPWMHGRGPWGRFQQPEMQALRGEFGEVMRLLAIAGRMSFQNPEQLPRLRAIIERARKDLSDMIYSANSEAGAQPSQEQSGTPTNP